MKVKVFQFHVGGFKVTFELDEETAKCLENQSDELCRETFARLACSIEPLVVAIKTGIKSGIYAGKIFEILQDNLDEAVDDIVLIERVDLPQTKTE